MFLRVSNSSKLFTLTVANHFLWDEMSRKSSSNVKMKALVLQFDANNQKLMGSFSSNGKYLIIRNRFYSELTHFTTIINFYVFRKFCKPLVFFLSFFLFIYLFIYFERIH